MNIRNVNILSIIVLLLLLLVQVVVVCGFWKVHEDNIKLQYHTLANDAINDWNFTHDVGVLDTTFSLLDTYARNHVVRLSRANNEADSLRLNSTFTHNTIGIISATENLSSTISDYFLKRQLATDYVDSLMILNFSIIGTNGRFINLIDNDVRSHRTLMDISTYMNETPYYTISLAYVIDINNKQALVVERILGVLFLSISSFVAVCLLFWFTRRNLIKERQVSEMKTDFINNMTHELKTPLSTISVVTRMLELEPIRNDKNKVLEKALQIKKQNDHLNGLINKMLDVNMWDNETFILDKIELPIDTSLQALCKEFTDGHDQDISIITHFDALDHCILFDKVYFNILVNNLLTNAVKYCDIDPEIHISTYVKNENIHIIFSDNGIGISAVDIKNIFNKFFRVRHGNLHKVKGLGLGLFYVKQIVDVHGGTIKANSKLSVGTTFEIVINIVDNSFHSSINEK